MSKSGEMKAYRDAIYAELEQTHPQSVRHVYYVMTVLGFIEKTQYGYNNVARQLGIMRRNGRVPYDWIVDNGRRMRTPWSSTSLKEALREVAHSYRLNIWAESADYVEVWCESNASGSILESVTEALNVPLAACGGFSSLSFLYEAGERISKVKNLYDPIKEDIIYRPVHLLYFGDWDPSGKKIEEAVERDLRGFTGSEIHFERIAVTPKQIKKMKLPTKPPKASAHTAGWTGETVELEAIPVSVLLDLCQDAIEKYIDLDHFNGVKEAEEADRNLLMKIAREHG